MFFFGLCFNSLQISAVVASVVLRYHTCALTPDPGHGCSTGTIEGRPLCACALSTGPQWLLSLPMTKIHYDVRLHET